MKVKRNNSSFLKISYNLTSIHANHDLYKKNMSRTNLPCTAQEGMVATTDAA